MIEEVLGKLELEGTMLVEASEKVTQEGMEEAPEHFAKEVPGAKTLRGYVREG